MKHDIKFGVLIPEFLREDTKRRDFLNILCDSIPDFSPHLYNNCEPLELVFDREKMDEVLELWQWNLLWKSKGGSVRGSVWTNSTTHNAVYVTIPFSDFQLEPLAVFIEDLDHRFGVDIAYIHSHSPADVADREYFKNHLMPFSRALTTHHLRRGLPGLCWGTFFGMPYRELIGGRLADVPAHSVREVGDTVFLQLTEDVRDPVRDWGAYAAARAAAMAHLGREFFLDSTSSSRPRIPEFSSVPRSG